MRKIRCLVPSCATFAGLALSLLSGTARAIQFEVTPFGDKPVSGVLNTTFTAGGGIRTEGRSTHIVGKSSLNPQICAPPYQSCQGLFRDQIYPAAHIDSSPGAPSVNLDDGDLNYAKGTLFQGVGKVTSDLTLTYGDFGIFARALYFYDFVNNDFRENHPNRITPQNLLQVGRCSSLTETRFYGQTSPTCTGLTGANPGFIVYGPGGQVRNHRTDGEILKQVGTNSQYLDSYVFGKFDVLDHDLTFKLGRQLVNWGESTTLVINSINQANPVNQNNFQRIGSQVEEVFTPINQLFLSYSPVENLTVEGYYQLEWKNIEIATPGSYFSTVDVGSNYTVNNIQFGFGGTAEDPSAVGRPLDNPLAGITPTSATVHRDPDREPRSSGQFGLKLGYYAEWLNGGTDLAFYFQHYHSRLPYVSFYSADPSCARREGNARGNDAQTTADFALDCPNIPLTAAATTGQPATRGQDSAVEFDSTRFLLEYPEDINLFGLSFNTTLGNYSFQGEVAYRPRLPLQVDAQDLALAALGPTLSRCHSGCVGTVGGSGTNASGGTTLYGSSDFVPAPGQTAFNDTFDLAVGALPGSARSFANFIIPYRGGVAGENTPNTYIRGYEKFQVYQFNLGATRVLGASDNYFGADQVILLAELGATYVPQLPPLDKLQFEADGTNYGAAAGADGSGFRLTNPALPYNQNSNPYVPTHSRAQSCSSTVDCSQGPDGLRFNPHQQDPTGFPDKFSWGYRLISLIRYESVFPGISFQPTIILAHDVQGTSPGPGGNFIAGRKQANTLVEMRYKSNLSLNAGYTWFWGGGVYNLISDRDFAQFFVKYSF